MYKNLVNVSCASTTEVFRHIKDFLTSRNGISNYSTTGLGWTLHDSYFAGSDQDAPAVDDWVVVSSVGENGKQALFYRMLFSSIGNGIIQCMAGLYWNASTNAWVRPFYTTDINSGPSSGSTFSLWIYGDLDSFIIVIGNGTLNYGRYFGLATNTMHDATIATSIGSVTSGSDRVVTVDSVPSSWAIGKRIFIRDNAAIERTTITNIVGNDVTMTLANGYGSGARLAREYSVYLTSSANFLLGGYNQIRRNGNLGSIGNYGSNDAIMIDNGDPDLLNDCHITNPTFWYDTNIGNYGSPRNILNVSATSITSGTVYEDDATGDDWRALLINTRMYLLKEV